MDGTDIEQLLRAMHRDGDSETTQLRETHISWVILVGLFAYKIKKAVNFGFLDFSSLKLRRFYCEEELRLNRRFAPELYLAVVPITQDPQGPRIAGDGPTIDYAVKMHRFNDEQLLAAIAERDGLDPALLRALARELARVHENLPAHRADPHSSEPGTPAALLAASEQNFQQIRKYALPWEQVRQLREIENWSQRRYRELLPAMRQRLSDGKVIDGHGDAHLGNIALVDGAVRLFDCIEFNASFRVMDSISEVAFLNMDMDARGYHEASHRLLTDYLEYSGDYDGLRLLGFYRCYFAMVRAKVNLLREPLNCTTITDTNGYREFLRYLALALCCTGPVRRFLAITHGVSGSGKSTVAGALVACSGAVRIRSDVERKRLAGMAPEQRSEPQQRTVLYSASMSRKTFARLEELARIVVEAGFPVIVDATFLQRRTRNAFRALARTQSVPFVIVDCIAQPEQLRQRLIRRGTSDASEADVVVLEQQLVSAQALTPEEQAYRLAVNSTEDTATLWQRFQTRCFG